MSRRQTQPTRLVIAAIFAASAAFCAPAAAQSAKELAAAKAAFHEGEEAEAKGDYRTALTKFEAAAAVKTTPQLLLRIGDAQEKLGKLVDALGSYQRGYDKAGSLPAVAKIAKEQIDALKPRIPMLTVVIAKPPAGLVITLDDTPVATAALGTAIQVDPGRHRIRAEAPGYKPRDQAFTATERGATRVELDLTSLSAGPIAQQPPAAPPPRGSKLPGIIALGAGGAALIAGAALIGISFAKDGSINDLCGGSDRLRCPISKKDQIDGDVATVNAMRFSGLGVGVIGAAGVAVGSALLVKAGKAPPAAGSAVQVVPVVGGGTTGIGAIGRF